MSERLSLPFYGIVEGPWVTGYSSAIVFISQPTGEYLLVAGSAALVAVHANVLRGRRDLAARRQIRIPERTIEALHLSAIVYSVVFGIVYGVVGHGQAFSKQVAELPA